MNYVFVIQTVPEWKSFRLTLRSQGRAATLYLPFGLKSGALRLGYERLKELLDISSAACFHDLSEFLHRRIKGDVDQG